MDRSILKLYIVAVTLFLFLIAFIALFSTGVEPQFYIQQLHVREDFTNSTNPNNTYIFIDLEIKRVLSLVPLTYDDININLYYDFSVIGHSVVPRFYQRETVHRSTVVVVHDSYARRVISNGSAVGLRLELTTNYWSRGDECGPGMPVGVATDLSIDGSGEALKNPIRLC